MIKSNRSHSYNFVQNLRLRFIYTCHMYLVLPSSSPYIVPRVLHLPFSSSYHARLMVPIPVLYHKSFLWTPPTPLRSSARSVLRPQPGERSAIPLVQPVYDLRKLRSVISSFLRQMCSSTSVTIRADSLAARTSFLRGTKRGIPRLEFLPRPTAHYFVGQTHSGIVADSDRDGGGSEQATRRAEPMLIS